MCKFCSRIKASLSEAQTILRGCPILLVVTDILFLAVRTQASAFGRKIANQLDIGWHVCCATCALAAPTFVAQCWHFVADSHTHKGLNWINFEHILSRQCHEETQVYLMSRGECPMMFENDLCHRTSWPKHVFAYPTYDIDRYGKTITILYFITARCSDGWLTSCRIRPAWLLDVCWYDVGTNMTNIK